jgi:hypothetical protein
LESAAIALAVAAVVGVAIVKGEFRRHTIVFCYYGVAIVMAGYLRPGSDLTQMTGFDSCTRYFLVPSILLSWILLLAVRHRRLRFSAALLSALLLITALHEFRRPPMEDQQWPFWIEHAQKNPGVAIPINPPGWTTDLGCRGVLKAGPPPEMR